MKQTKYQTVSYEEDIPKTLGGFKDWEFSSGGTIGDDFRVFAILFKKQVAGKLPAGARLVNFSRGHYYISGFIERGGKFVYFSISDVRHFKGDWHSNILIRTAKSASDYTGGGNGYTNLENFTERVSSLLN